MNIFVMMKINLKSLKEFVKHGKFSFIFWNQKFICIPDYNSSKKTPFFDEINIFTAFLFKLLYLFY